MPEDYPGLELEHLPSCIAIPLSDLQRETHPVVRLWKICDVAELLLRLVVSIKAPELDGQIDDDTARLVIPLIERPTLYDWLELAQHLTALKKEQCIIPELYDSVASMLTPLLVGEDGHGDHSQTIMSLRNHLAHGAGISNKAAGLLVPGHIERLQSALSRMEWLSGIRLLAAVSGGVLLLQGPGPAGRKVEGFPASEDLKQALHRFPNGVVLSCPGGLIPLWPLQAYGIPGTVKKGKQVQSDSPAPMVYTKRHGKKLELTALGSDVSVVMLPTPALARLKSLFRLNDRKQLRGEVEEGFSREFREEAASLIGREIELAAVLEAVQQNKGGVLWLHGLPGRGKSALMAATATRLAEAGKYTLVVYRFRTGDPRGTKLAFLRYATSLLAQDDTVQPADNVKKLEQYLGELLQKASSHRRVVFVLDGLDEIDRIDEDFRSLPFRLTGEKILWLCAGRPEPHLQEVFSKERCKHIFEKDGLGPLTGESISSWLKRDAPPAQRDRIVVDEREGISPWVEKVTKRSEGLPAYLTLLLDDLRTGAVQVGAVVPNGLTSYFDELLEQSGVDDAAAALPVVMAALVLSIEAPDAETLVEVLRHAGRLSEETGDMHLEIIKEALQRARSMLKIVPTAHHTEGYIPYHDALAKHLLHEDSLSDARAAAGAGLCSLSMAPWSASTAAAKKHAFSTGVRQLLALAQPEKAEALLSQFGCLMQRLDTLGGEGVFSLVEDFRRVSNNREKGLDALGVFVRERAHQIARGGAVDLLQLAIAEADTSPVTLEAENWLSQNPWNRIWLRKVGRPVSSSPSACIRTLEGHTDWVNTVTFHSDGERIISGSQDGTIRLWSRHTGRCLMTINAHHGGVCAVLQHPDGCVISSGWDNLIRIWSLQDGACLATIRGHTAGVGALALAPDGLHLVSGSEDKTVKIWKLDGGSCLLTLKGHTAGICALAVHPDGQLIVSAGRNKTIKVWSLSSGHCTANLAGHTSSVHALVLHMNLLLSGSQDRSVRLWNLDRGNPYKTLRGHSRKVNALALCPDGERVLSGSQDHTLKLWQLSSGACLRTLSGHAEGVTSVAVHPHGPAAVSGSQDYTLKLWSLEGEVTSQDHRHHSKSVVALCADERRLVSAGSDHNLRVWELETGQYIRILQGHTGTVSSVAMLPGGERVLSGSYDTTLKLWSLESGACLKTFRGHTSLVRAVLVHPDGERAVSCGFDSTLRVWSLDREQDPRVLKGHTGVVHAAALHPDGERLVSAGEDNSLMLWSLTGGACLKTFTGHSAGVRVVLIHPEGQYIISGSDDSTMRLWDIDTGESTALTGHRGVVSAVTVSPDGGSLISADSDGGFKIWDFKTGACLRTIRAHTGKICSIAQHKGILVSAGEDRLLKLWDWHSGAYIAHWSAESAVECCLVTGRRVVFGEQSGRVGVVEPVGVGLELPGPAAPDYDDSTLPS